MFYGAQTEYCDQDEYHSNKNDNCLKSLANRHRGFKQITTRPKIATGYHFVLNIP